MSLCRRNLHEMEGDNISATTRACKSCENARKRGEALPPIVSKAELFRAELQRRYPCSAYPAGAIAEIAGGLGLNLSTAARYARQIEWARLPKPPKYICICGKVMVRKGSVCLKCRKVELPCVSPGCGKLVTRSAAVLASDYAWRNAHPEQIQNKGKVFCDRKCHGRWLGLANRQQPEQAALRPQP